MTPLETTLDESLDSTIPNPVDYRQLDCEGLSLDIFNELRPIKRNVKERLARVTEKLPLAWQALAPILTQEQIGSDLNPQGHPLEMELYWVDNARIQELNRDYRNQDSATDVLTFTLLADHPEPSALYNLPVVPLGSMFISAEWAEDAVQGDIEALEPYLMERFVHGLLHLHGQHHDTMDQFNKVVTIQHKVLSTVFKHVTDTLK